MPELSASDWENFLAQYPDTHILQAPSWGELKSAFGWETRRVVSSDHTGGAQVLFRRLPLGFHMAYIPKGPVGAANWPSLQAEIDALCRRKRTAFIKIEPDVWATPDGLTPDPPPGFILSRHTIQPPRTILVDLNGDEERILSRMKQKTRYNIKLANKKDVIVRPSTDLGSFQRLIQTTGGRDGFSVHSQTYYQCAYDLFHPRGQCELLCAEFQSEPLAALMVFMLGRRAWYFYGASSNEHRDRMPTYLLQWEAMRWTQNHGCTEYDLWGIPDADEPTLEAQFMTRTNGLWGVYRFKRGFGGQVCRAAGPWDRVYLPPLYAFYRWWIRRSGDQ